MSRWFVRIPTGPQSVVVVFGPPKMGVTELWARVPERLKKPDRVWRHAFDLRPKWSKQEPRHRGWRRANSTHVGDGVRVTGYSDFGAVKRTDVL